MRSQLVIGALLLLLILIPSFPSEEAIDNDPRDVVVSNEGRFQFTLSWWTWSETNGCVEWGDTPNRGNVTYSQWGTSLKGNIHVAVVSGLDEDTPYYFRVVSSGVPYGDGDGDGDIGTGDANIGGTPWVHSTLRTTGGGVSWPHVLVGRMFDPEGVEAQGAIAYCYLSRGTRVSRIMSAIVDEDGTFGILSHGAVTVATGEPFKYEEGDTIHIRFQGGRSGEYPATGWDDGHSIAIEYAPDGEQVIEQYLGDFVLIDLRPPEVLSVAVTSRYVRSPITVEAQIRDNVAVHSAVLLYRKAGEVAYNPVPMTQFTGTIKNGSWRGEIPAYDELCQVEYYLNVSDGVTFTDHPSPSAPATIDLLPKPLGSILVSTPDAVANESTFVNVTVYDVDGDKAAFFDGTIAFTSTDPLAELPGPYTFQPSVDAGGHNFTGVRLFASGTQEIRVADAETGIWGNVMVDVSHGPLFSILVAPDVASVLSDHSVDFDALGFDEFGNQFAVQVEWWVSGDVGTIDQSGTFTGIKVGSGIVHAQSGEIAGSASVTVISGEQARMEPASCLSLSCPVNSTAGPLAVSLVDVNQNPVTGATVAWSITSKPLKSNNTYLTDGSIASSTGISVLTNDSGVSLVILHVGERAGEYEVEASVGGLEGSPQVFAVSARPLEVTEMRVNPSDVSVQVGREVQFQAEGYDRYGNPTDTNVTWAVEGGIGTINATTGTFKAGTLVCSGSVVGRSDGVESNATVTIEPGELFEVVINSETTGLVVDSTQTFQADGYDAYGNRNYTLTPVWSSSSGIMYQSGFYRAPTTVGSVDIFARCGDIVGTLPISILPGALERISISPMTSEHAQDAYTRFLAAGYDKYGNQVTINPYWTTSLGTIDQSGLFVSHQIGSGRISVSYGGVTSELDITVVDKRRPTVESTTPGPNATSVPTGIEIWINFSEPMNPTTVENSFYFDDLSGAFWWRNSSSVFFVPEVELEHGRAYTVSLTAVARDLSGNSLVPFELRFTTAQAPDTDGDGVPDPEDEDIDGDGIPNEWEQMYQMDPSDPSDALMDIDGDGLMNLDEFLANSDPTKWDTDGDGRGDAVDPNPSVWDPPPIDWWEILLSSWFLGPLSIVLLFTLFYVIIRRVQRRRHQQMDSETPIVRTRAVECPMCNQEFSVEETELEVTCPACGAQGKVG